jgi:hypothetical protein
MYLLRYFEQVVLVPTDIRLEWLQKRTHVAAGLLFTSVVDKGKQGGIKGAVKISSIYG